MSKHVMTAPEIERGIAAYEHEQRAFLRLLRKRGSFTAREFDMWFVARKWRRPRFRSTGITGDTFLLGLGINGGNLWAEMLELLQMMVRLGLVDATKDPQGMVVYSLPSMTAARAGGEGVVQ